MKNRNSKEKSKTLLRMIFLSPKHLEFLLEMIDSITLMLVSRAEVDGSAQVGNFTLTEIRKLFDLS